MSGPLLAEPTVLWRRGLFCYFAVLAVVGFWPTPIDKPLEGTLDRVLGYLHRHGIPDWFGYGLVEASANVLLFLPVGLLAALAFPWRRWWLNAGLGVLASICIELGQMAFFSQRYPSWLDLVTNTLGTLVGVLAVLSLRRQN